MGVHKDLLKDVNEILELVIHEKKFIFTELELSNEYSLLIDNEVIHFENGRYELLKSTYFTQGLFDYFAAESNFKLTNDFKDNISLIETVEDYFSNTRKNLIGISQQVDNLYDFLFLQTIKISKKFPQEYALSLKREDDHALWRFVASFSRIFVFENELSDFFNPVIIHLYTEIYDTNKLWRINPFLNRIKDFCIKKPKEGRFIFSKIQTIKDTIFNDLKTAIIIGIYLSNKRRGYEFLKNIKNDLGSKTSIICAIPAFIPNNEEALLLLDLIDDMLKDKSLLVNIPRVYGSFIINENISDNSIIQKCFAKLSWLIKSDELSVKKATIFSLPPLQKYCYKIFKILDNLNSSKIDTNLHSLIANKCLVFNTSQSLFFSFLINYSEKNRDNFRVRDFECLITELQDQNPSIFCAHLTSLLIHDEGRVRFIGKRIIQYFLTSHGKNFNFAINLLKCSALKQFKFLISLFQDSLEPKELLPLVLPLRNSRYPSIKETLYYKISELVDNYPSSAVKELKTHINKRKKLDRELLKFAQLKEDEIFSLRKGKSQIKELNPLYTQSNLYKVYHENFGSKFNVNKSVRENSTFFNMCETIILAKGGGWMDEKTGQETKLTTFSTSFQFPRSYYISPEEYDWNTRVGYIDNWGNIYKEWEVTISSLENT